MKSKSCSCCRVFKPLAAFYHDKDSRDGLHHRCSRCDNIRHKQRRRDGRMQASIDGWCRRHPLAKPAHQAVARALKDGTLHKQPCCVCGSAKDLHAHHDDYTKPLTVRWHCRLHHIEHHRLERLYGKGQTLFGFMEDAA